MHLNEVHFSRNKISQLKSTTLKKTDVKTSTHKDHNIIEKQLNSVTEIINCKQLILHAIIRVLIIHKIIYNFNSKFIVKLIKILQQENEFTVKLKADEMMNIQKNNVEA